MVLGALRNNVYSFPLHRHHFPLAQDRCSQLVEVPTLECPPDNFTFDKDVSRLTLFSVPMSLVIVANSQSSALKCKSVQPLSSLKFFNTFSPPPKGLKTTFQPAQPASPMLKTHLKLFPFSLKVPTGTLSFLKFLKYISCLPALDVCIFCSR